MQSNRFVRAIEQINSFDHIQILVLIGLFVWLGRSKIIWCRNKSEGNGKRIVFMRR